MSSNRLSDVVVHGESGESSDSDSNEVHPLLGKDDLIPRNMATLAAPIERPKEPSKSVITFNNNNNNNNTSSNNKNNNSNNDNNKNKPRKISNKNDNSNSKKVNNQKPNASFPASPSASASAAASAAGFFYTKYFLWSWRLLRRKQVLVFLALILIYMLYLSSASTEESESRGRIPVVHHSHVPGMKGYLVWSERCKMPNIDPYLPEVMKYFRREKYKRCAVQNPLTTVAFSEASRSYVLRVNEDVILSYTKAKTVDCCYRIIDRNSTGLSADKDVSLSSCIGFKKSAKLAPHIDNILVKCRAKKKQVYVNGHAMMPERPELRTRLDAWRHNDTLQKRHRPPSVLMIGIDSISRVNLIRAMPKTAQYLYNNEWFEMSGYNKVDDNTFPNLMAVLTGLNKTHTYAKCPPTMLNALDNCNFVWNTFREHGYVTAYGEDEAAINTFNYLKAGFERSPVDFYLRPFLLAAEKNLRVQTKSSLINCLGYQHSAEFVYEYAIELARRFKHDPFFGLFWTNTFSHNAISDCSAMDEKMVDYLKRFGELGTFENTIVIFFSDHGIRFGPTRATYSGHLEERLPFMFVWLPQQLKQLHPEFVNALNVNKNRLTNPYDLHMTLKHVLKMSGRVEDPRLLAQAEDCPRCQTLLEPVSHNRSCSDVAIEDHWCTCIPYQSVYKNSKMVQNLAENAVSYINKYVADFKNGSFVKLCVTLQLKNVESAHRAQPGIAKLRTDFGNRTIDTYRIIFQTKPNNALFEATIHYSAPTIAFPDPLFEVTGEISRINSYSADSECVEDGGAKKYCSCHKKKLL